ncbi:MAG: hypothetical protein AAGF85_17780 [Bacteroidota bacterium]
MKNATMKLYLMAELNPHVPDMADQHMQDVFDLMALLLDMEEYQQKYVPALDAGSLR